ncbi:MAG TPA: M48 family metallopeptidase [Gemmatimonas sp.]|nr:M48 family metallopeptidase [Gemmatimonas sp.]
MTAPSTGMNAARTPLTQISSVTWEHPADRAALNSLRALPGFDTVVRRVASLTGERTVRNLFLGDAVLVGPTQRPALYALFRDVLAALDWPDAGGQEPQLYVTQSPIVSATAVGFENPFIVISSGTLELLDDDERRFVLAHELGHIMSGHMTYRTMAIIMVYFGVAVLPFLGAVALLPFQLALLEWYRKSELSADRAGLLGTQDPRGSMMAFLKLAGGKQLGDSIDLDAYLAQAVQYETGGTGWDSVLKALNTVLRELPLHTVRAAELHRWEQSGAYADIVAGGFTTRGAAGARPLGDDVRDATDYYAEQAKAAVDSVEDVLNKAANAFKDAFRATSAL